MTSAAGRAGNDRDFFVTFKTGESVYGQGDEGDSMYIIEDGRIEIIKQAGGESQTLAHLEQGDFFGEMSLLDDEPREASARASTDTQLLRIDKSTFDQMLRQNPEIAVRILRKLARRLRALETSREVRPAPAEIPASTAVLGAMDAPVGADPARATSVRRFKFVSEATGDAIALPEKPELTVGRPDPVTGTVPDIDLSKFDTNRSVSRRHAKIHHRGDAFFLSEEIGAANGTFVNKERIPAGNEIPLAENDVVEFGRVVMTFRRE